jgi:RimJ/RimL family protein N-acetyltransferase/gamma-glutamylcyclotransferase (GGCT)/AIG2-like uncharacterized protein YtfP
MDFSLPVSLESLLNDINARLAGPVGATQDSARQRAIELFGASERLIVYGSLAPGRENHRELAVLAGEWTRGWIRGELLSQGWGAQLGYPALRWRADGERVPAWILCSSGLPADWARLDAFEGAAYQRQLAPFETDDGVVAVGYVYTAVVGVSLRSAMVNIELLGLDRTTWEKLAEDPAAFAAQRKLALGAEPDVLRTVGRQTAALLERTKATTPWTGYLAVDRQQRIIVGTCGFTGPPDPDGAVEIAYFTFPSFEGRGYASAMAAGLVKLAKADAGIRRVRAHTLPERNASTRILEKLGFERVGESIDPDAGSIWRWERDPSVRGEG